MVSGYPAGDAETQLKIPISWARSMTGLLPGGVQIGGPPITFFCSTRSIRTAISTEALEGVVHKKSTCPKDLKFGCSWRDLELDTNTVRIQSGIWYQVQYRMKLNSPGQSNGVFEVWIDGAKVYSVADVDFRGGMGDESYSSLGWNIAMLSRRQSSGPTQSIYWDEFIVSPDPVVGRISTPSARPKPPFILP